MQRQSFERSIETRENRTPRERIGLLEMSGVAARRHGTEIPSLEMIQ
jgi:hypothetical protein